jgi:Transposase, Mutator family
MVRHARDDIRARARAASMRSFLPIRYRLKGFPQAIESVFPEARIQLCIVHLVRASLNYVNWLDFAVGRLSMSRPMAPPLTVARVAVPRRPVTVQTSA